MYRCITDYHSIHTLGTICMYDIFIFMYTHSNVGTDLHNLFLFLLLVWPSPLLLHIFNLFCYIRNVNDPQKSCVSIAQIASTASAFSRFDFRRDYAYVPIDCIKQLPFASHGLILFFFSWCFVSFVVVVVVVMYIQCCHYIY